MSIRITKLFLAIFVIGLLLTLAEVQGVWAQSLPKPDERLPGHLQHADTLAARQKFFAGSLSLG